MATDPIAFRIDRVDAAGCRLLATLHAACFSPGWDHQAFDRLLVMPGAISLLASQMASAGAPMGLILGRVAAAECEIITLAVLPDRRGQGVGRALLDEITALATADGAREMLLEVACDNGPAMALYRGAGFAQVGRRANYYRGAGKPPVDALIMRRPLAGSDPGNA
ncbi:MAG: N-acetyltransferase [Alphaproteobacteria bacterium]|nr:N-acetyltransferase [Alphaproteobacteria bacterium]